MRELFCHFHQTSGFSLLILLEYVQFVFDMLFNIENNILQDFDAMLILHFTLINIKWEWLTRSDWRQ